MRIVKTGRTTSIFAMWLASFGGGLKPNVACGGSTATTPTVPTAAVTSTSASQIPSSVQIPGGKALVLAAEFDYARLPRELWPQRMRLARLAGFNALTIPVPWAYHEPQPGDFLFQGPRDVAHLLDLCHRENLWAIVRAGPYLGGDWELGGLPPWLAVWMTHPRAADQEFLAACDHWFERLAPLIAERQAHRGGSVIAVEVERVANPAGMGETAAAGPEQRVYTAEQAYFDRLSELLRSLGIEVPIVAGCAAEGDREVAAGDLAPDARATLRLGKARPWGEEDVVVDRSAEIPALIARGARRLDCQSFFGGTDFDFQAAEGLAARLDRGAPVGEAGDVRPTFFALQSWLLWAQSAAPLVLEGRCEATSIPTSDGGHLPVRRFASPAGELLMVENRRGVAQTVDVAVGDSSPTIERVRIAARSAWPIVRNWKLSDSIAVEGCAGPLIHAGSVAGRRLLIAAVPPGEARTIAFRTATTPRVEIGDRAFTATSGGCVLRMTGSLDGAPQSFRFTAREGVQVVAVPDPMAAKTWCLNVHAREAGSTVSMAGCDALLMGGDAILDVATSPSGLARIVVGSQSPSATFRLYCDADSRLATSRGRAVFASEGCYWTIRPDAKATSPPAPLLGRWEQRDDRDVMLSGDVTPWTLGSEPRPVEQLPATVPSPYSWYRTALEVPDASTYTLRLGGIGDRATVFLNGLRLGSVEGAHCDEIAFELPAGRFALSIMVEHDGRDDLSRAPWPIPEHCFKGLRPPAILVEGGPRWPIPWWQFVANNRGLDCAREIALSDSGAENWQFLAKPGPDDMNHLIGFAWYRFGGDPLQPFFRFLAPNEGTLEIYVDGADDRAWVYLDGQLVGMHDDPRHGSLIRVPDSLPIRQETTSHSLAIAVENRHGPGGLTGPVRVGLTQRDSRLRVGPWWMRVGLTGEHEGWFRPPQPAAQKREAGRGMREAGSDKWDDLTSPTVQTAVRWYRTRFPYLPDPSRAETFLLHLGSLRRGSVWLNGHSLGRYRQVGWDARRGVVLPTCWLERDNWIVVAETGGGLPLGASLRRDPASHLYLTTLRLDEGRATK